MRHSVRPAQRNKTHLQLTMSNRMSSYATIRPVRIGGQALLVAFEFLYPPPLPSTRATPTAPYIFFF